MKKVGLMILAVVLMAGCSKKNNNDDERTAISLSSRLHFEVQRNARQDVQIAEGQMVSFFVTPVDQVDSELFYDNVRLTADGVGGFEYYYAGATTLYYPLSGENVDFYGIHPFDAGIALEAGSHNFNVEEDQSGIRDFFDSDLLWVKVSNVARSKNAVLMQFSHKLTKISFVLKAGAGANLEGLSNIDVMNVLTETSFDPATGILGSAVGDPASVTAFGADDFEIKEEKIEGIAAIIVPQVFEAGASKRLFKITVEGSDFYYTPPNDINFESGKNYRYILTLTNTGIIEVTSEIVDWVHADDTEGEGVLE